MSDLREDIFHLCFGQFDGKLAGGQRANNKFDAEKIRHNQQLRGQVADAVSELAISYSPDMLVAVPNGANWLGIEVAWRIGTALVLLNKDYDTGKISYRRRGRQQIETSESLLIIEDVPNRRTTTQKVLALPGISERAVGEVAILDRGIDGEIQEVPIPIDALFIEPIPAILPDNSSYWKYI